MAPPNPRQFHQMRLPIGVVPEKVRFLHTPTPRSMPHGEHYPPTLQEIPVKAREFQEAVTTGVPAIRFPRDAVEGLREVQRFKSQHETNTSRGMLSPPTRASYEERAFGYPRKLNPSRRPIYGYVSPPTEDWHGDRVTAYGGLKAVLKPHMKERATVTHGDSLNEMTPMRWHEAEGWNPPHGIKAENLTVRPSYVEAQYHGGVKLSDVEHLEIGNEDWGGVTAAQDLNLPWRMVATEQTSQHPIPPTYVRKLADGYDETAEEAHRFWKGFRVRGADERSPLVVVNNRQFTKHRSKGFRSVYET